MKMPRLFLAFSLLLYASIASAQVRVHYINVGQADSILLEFRKDAVLIDAGAEDTGPTRRDERHLLSYLNDFFTKRPDLNKTLLSVIISHPHIDHTRTLLAVMRSFKVRSLVDGGNNTGSGIGPLNQARAFAKQKHIPYRAVTDAEVEKAKTGLVLFPQLMTSSEVDLRVLDGSRECDDENNDSLIVRVRYRKASFLFSGDAEVDDKVCVGEIPILLSFYKGTGLLDVDVYKAGHHGSRNGTNEDLMRAMSPKISVISAGIHTQHEPGKYHAFQFGHPREQALSLMERFSSGSRVKVDVYTMPAQFTVQPRSMNKSVYCTCWDGDVRVTTNNADGSDLRVQTSGRPDGNGPIN